MVNERNWNFILVWSLQGIQESQKHSQERSCCFCQGEISGHLGVTGVINNSLKPHCSGFQDVLPPHQYYNFHSRNLLKL